MNGSWLKSRNLKERIVVQGTLVLGTPTHLGNGDADGPLDMPLITDPLKGYALLTGSSVAGALRAYVQSHNRQWANILFGRVTRTTSYESYLIVDDAIGETLPSVELRDGVAIAPITRTAEEGKKYDMELLEAGTAFNLSFEVLLGETNADLLLKAVTLALQGLETGKICLGKRKRRGFGKCRVMGWRVQRFDMTTPQGMLAWLKNEAPVIEKTEIGEALNVSLVGAPLSQTDWLTLTATLGVEGSVLIRSGTGKPGAPDVVHLRSKRGGQEQLILSGTSIAGALRAQALRIANTLNPKGGWEFVEGLFGVRAKQGDRKRKLTTSKLWIDEVEVCKPHEYVQTRLKIDRFTGGAYPGALFSEQAAFGSADTHITLKLRVQEPSAAQVGLLMLLLKDLWTGELPIGGGQNIGRGRLSGRHAELQWGGQPWILTQQGDALVIEGVATALQKAVSAFEQEMMAQ